MYPKEKKKKKKQHRNKRITEAVPCENECGRLATENHEWFNGNPYRQKSIKYKIQSKLCTECHTWYHQDKSRWLPWQKLHQKRVMIQEGWDKERWIKEFGENKLSDTELIIILTEIMKEQYTSPEEVKRK